MRTQLALTITLLLGCIDVDIIGGSDTTAGSTTAITGSTGSEGDGDGDTTSTADESTTGVGVGETSDSTETGDTSTETSSGDGDGEIGDGDADPGDGDGDGWLGQMCFSNTIVYLEPDPECETGTWPLCNVGDFLIEGPSDLVCCHFGLDCYIMATMEVCNLGDEAMCQIGPTMN